MAAELSPSETRAQDSDFVAQCSLAGLQERLPLSWPAPADIPPSPKRAYRSHYVYLGWQDLLEPTFWEQLDPFDLLLRLIDFSRLRPVLARRLGWTSARGWCPFDPVSLFLLLGWQITHGWNRSQLLRNLEKPRFADYARRFGFDGAYPTEGGLRYWLTQLGRHSESGETIAVPLAEDRVELYAIQWLNELLAQSIALLAEAAVFSPEALTRALVCPDGMLHEAASRMHCAYVQESCYQPPTPAHPRPCRAKERGQKGCDCDTPACASACRRATPRDAQARFVYYEGNNRAVAPLTEPPQDKSAGKSCYGYQSLPLQLADRARRFSVVLLDDFWPASARAEGPAAALLLQLAHFYPDLLVDAVAGDAGFGYEVFLATTYAQLQARRIIAQRRHQTDQNKALWPIRQYDDYGRPLCPYGYALTSNGFDRKRRRHKWFCGQACQRGKEPRVRLKETVYPPPECPHRERPRGLLINIGERFADDSIRLVRDVAVGSPTWKRLYHRGRNAVEGRNSTRVRWNLKRLPVYGTWRGKAFTFLADVWDNLTTLARLVQEATVATGY